MISPLIYKAKPVLVEAVQLKPETMHDIMKWANDETHMCWYLPSSKILEIHRVGEKHMEIAMMGDFVVKDDRGNFAGLSPEKFLATYVRS